MKSSYSDGSGCFLNCRSGTQQRPSSDQDFIAAEMKKALEELYKSTDGEHWTLIMGWMTNDPLPDWFGVRVDERGAVNELDLRENNLAGTIPASIATLTALQVLDLHSNSISGHKR